MSIDNFTVKLKGDSYGRCQVVEQTCKGTGCQQLVGSVKEGQERGDDPIDSPFPGGDEENPFRR